MWNFLLSYYVQQYLSSVLKVHSKNNNFPVLLTCFLDQMTAASREKILIDHSNDTALAKKCDSRSLNYIRRCDASLFVELTQLQLASDFDIPTFCDDISAQSRMRVASKNKFMITRSLIASPLSDNTASSSPPVNVQTNFQKKRKLLGKRESPTPPPSSKQSVTTPLSSKVKTDDDEYNSFSPPEVGSAEKYCGKTSVYNTKDDKYVPTFIDGGVSTVDVYTATLRVLVNLTHRCPEASLDICAAGGLLVFVAALAAWYQLRCDLKSRASNSDDKQVFNAPQLIHCLRSII